jgi:hypothetical protein
MARYGTAAMLAAMVMVLAGGVAGAADEPKPLDDACILACQATFDRGLARCNAGSADDSPAQLQSCVTSAQYDSQLCRTRCGGAEAGALQCYGKCRNARQSAVARCRDQQAGNALESCLIAADTTMEGCSTKCGEPPPDAAAQK